MKRLFCLFLTLLLLTALFACKRTEKPAEDPLLEVSFSTTLLSYAATPPASVSVKKGEKVPAPTLDAEPTAGYVVIWTKSASTKKEYDFSASVEESFTLYALEIPRTYSVRYLVENGKNISNPTSFTKESDTITLAAPGTDFGYHFLKWCYFDDPDSTVTEIPSGTEGDVVLRAVIEPVNYTIRYDDGGDENPNPTTYVFGTTLPLQSPSKAGHTFLGYTIHLDRNETPVTTLTPEFVSGTPALFRANGVDIYLHANWEEQK